MHELGILCQVAGTVIDIAKRNNVTVIDTLVLQIGELSPVVPRYLKACYPAAVDGTMLEGTKLKLEIVKASAVCRPCGETFPAVAHKGVCPRCGGSDCTIVSGKELFIKEIVAR